MRKKPPTKEKQLSLAADSPAQPFRHQSRRGEAYYLHRGTTKTGKARFFFAKTVGEGAIAEMPAGYEVAESVNGVVTVRRAVPSLIPAADVALVREALARDDVLRACVVDTKGDAIIVHEPEGGGLGGFGGDAARLAKVLGLDRGEMAAFQAASARRTRYAPVMKFEPAFDGKKRGYLASRWIHRGDGRWWALSIGPLASLLDKYLHHIGRESFYELL